MKEIILKIENSQGHENFEIHYKNGFIYEGFLSRITNNYKTVILSSNEDVPDHILDYPNITKVVVKPLNGKESYTLLP